MQPSCPKCGHDSYSYRDPGVLEYTGIFGGGSDGEEVVSILHPNAPPVYCRCNGCGKRFKIAEARDILTPKPTDGTQ